ncbi:MAG: hypothetical protein AABY22_00510 [Nanoarchaeota archaeon]
MKKNKFKWWEKIYYPLWRKYDWFIHIPEEIKYFLQRVFRGYGDDDLWSLDWFIVKKVRKPLKAFINYQINNGHGCPADFFDKDINGNECIRWIECLKKIERAFDLSYKEGYGGKYYEKSVKQLREDGEDIQEGFELFGKYLQNLWD